MSAYAPRVAKGKTEVTFNFSFDNEKIIKLSISDDLGIRHTSSLKQIPTQFKCVLTPDDSEYAILRYYEVVVRHDNFSYNRYILPIYVAQPSYYTYLEGLQIENTQFLDNLAADVFAVLKTDSNQHYHTILRANAVNSSTPVVINNAIVTADNKYIQTSQADILIAD